MSRETISNSEMPKPLAKRSPIFDPEAEFDTLKTEEFSLGVFAGSYTTWKAVKQELAEIHDRVFKPIIRNHIINSSYRRQVEKKVTNEETLLITLNDKRSGKMIGFTMAFPTSIPTSRLQLQRMVEQSKEYNYYQKSGLSFKQYQDLQMQTIEVGETVILPEFRHKGGWSLMMRELERRMQRLKDEGKYQSMIRVVRDEGNYSQKVKNRYEGQLVYTHNLEKRIGPQKYYRFRL